MPLKVLHLPTPVGGHAWGLSRGERRIGIKSDVLVLANNWLEYPFDINLHLDKANSKLEKLIKLLRAFIKIHGNYDIYHFNFGTSLVDFPHLGLNLLDIPFYGNRSKIFVTYNGCDARQKYATMNKYNYSACHRDGCYGGICMDAEVEKNKRARIRKFSQYSSAAFALNPDLFSFLPEKKAFIPYAISGWDQIEYLGIKERKTLRIVHAPTNRIVKGSDYVMSACERIKDKYGNIVQVQIVENMSNQEALKIYADADLVIDQLLLGWYGGFAVEVMKMGKPVMCFIREEDLQYIPKAMAEECQAAIINVTKDTIYEKLCEIIENRSVLFHYSAKAREYVQNWHSPIKVATMVNKYYQS